MSWKLTRKLRQTLEGGSNQNLDVPPPPPSTVLLPDSVPSPQGVLTVTLYEFEGPAAGEKTGEFPRGRLPKVYALLDYDKSQELVYCAGYAQKLDVVRSTELGIHIYQGNPTTKSESRQAALAGTASLSPFDRLTVSGKQWVALQNDAGRVRIGLGYEHFSGGLFGPGIDSCLIFGPGNDSRFLMEGRLGGNVLLCRKMDTGRYYAVKRVKAASVAAGRQIHHPFITPLLYAAPSTSQEGWVYLIAPFVPGGHVLNYLQTTGRFDVETAQVLAAEIVCALDYLHQHHDAADVAGWLKPGNVTLDTEGHLSLSGFGLFQTRPLGQRSAPEYPAPECVLGGEGCRASEAAAAAVADWWTLGVLLFEMLTGLPPFYAADEASMRRRILDGAPPAEAPGGLPPAAHDVLARLLDAQPATRLGAAGGAAEVQAHPFFAGVDWTVIVRRERAAPFWPPYTEGPPLRHYGVSYPAEVARASPEFRGFTYPPGAVPELPPKELADEITICGSCAESRQHEFVSRPEWLQAVATARETEGREGRGEDDTSL